MADSVKSTGGRIKVFSADTRLRRRADFLTIREHGETAVGRYCVIRVLKPPPDGRRRVAFVISRHYSGKAVLRNRCRRLFRELYRQMLPEWNDCWLEFRPRARMRGIKLADLAADVEQLLKRLKIRSPSGGNPGR